MKNKFLNLGIISNRILNLSPKETYKNCTENNAIIVDVREENITGFKHFEVPKVLYLPFSDIKEKYHSLPTDIPLIFADAAGLRSKEAVEFMKNTQYNNIANMAGGLVEWERDQLPLNIDFENRLSGSCMCQLRYRDRKKAKS